VTDSRGRADDRVARLARTVYDEVWRTWKQSNAGITSGQLKAALPGRAEDVVAATHRAVAEGWVEVVPGPRSAKHHYPADRSRNHFDEQL
jgi:hypothetical protein